MKPGRSLLPAPLLAVALLAAPLAPPAGAQCTPAELAAQPTLGPALGVTVADGIAWIASSGAGLLAVDVSDPTRPRALADLDTPERATRSVLRDGWLYVADGIGGGLVIVDARIPSLPQLVSVLPHPDDAAGVDLAGNIAIVAAKTSGLLLVDVSDPALPVLRGTVATSGYARNVEVRGHRAYVAAWQAGLLVYDVSNPLSPQLLGTAPTSDRAVDLAVSGSIVAIADRNAGFRLVDVTNPASPHTLSTVATADEATGVAFADDRLLVSAGAAGLLVYDASDAGAPRLLGTADTPGYAYDPAVDGTVALVPDWGSGLRLVDVAGCLVEPPVASFVRDVTSPRVGETVAFADASTGAPTSWHWDFGDGTSAFGSTASHVWSSAGTFRVTLTVANAAGTSVANADVVVTCPAPCGTDPWLVLPGAARAPGAAGTLWRSDLVLFAEAPGERNYRIEFIPFGASAPTAATELALPSGGTAEIVDLLGTRLGISEGAGTIRVKPLGDGFRPLPRAALRTSNTTPAGRFGQWIEGRSDAFGATTASWIPGLVDDATGRTNLLVASVGEGAIQVDWEAFGPAGNAIASGRVALAGGESRLVPMSGPLAGVGPFSLRLAGDGPFLAGASRIDAATGDPTWIPDDAPFVHDGARPRVLPGIAKTPGAEGTSWRSRFVAVNPGATAVDLRLRFVPAGSPSAPVERTVTLAPRGGLDVADLLGDLFGLAGPTWGWLEVDDGGAGTGILASTWNDAPAGGGFGQTIPPAMPVCGDLCSARMPGAARSAGVRTNLGLVDVGGTAPTVGLALLAPSGQLVASRTISLPAGDAWQGDLFAGTSLTGDLGPFTVVFTPPAGSNVVAYLSRIEAGTGDPLFVPATIVPLHPAIPPR